MRLERASIELRLSNDEARSAAEIGLRNGFKNASHFRRLFKAKYGLTPNEWRNRG